MAQDVPVLGWSPRNGRGVPAVLDRPQDVRRRSTAIDLHPELKEAKFVRRLNRFSALMICEGKETLAHVANSGRLGELLVPDNPMLLTPVEGRPDRKTAFDLSLVQIGDVLVSADSRLPNQLVSEATQKGSLPEFREYDGFAREVKFEDSRLDIRLTGPEGLCYIEVKSVTLVENDTGLFPDAPTERGRRHLETLVMAVGQGHRAAVLFVVQRPDASALVPNRPADPDFSDTLADAIGRGVEAYAYRCTVSRRHVRLAESIPVQTGQ